MGLRRIRPCTPGETGQLADYLSRTPVAGYSPPLRDGTAIASTVDIAGRPPIGEARSIFGDLGGIKAPVTVERTKFIVREVRAILARPECTDNLSRKRLDELLAAEAGGTLVDRRITLALTAGGTLIVDGNKRAAAIHELADVDFVLPAFRATRRCRCPERATVVLGRRSARAAR